MGRMLARGTAGPSDYALAHTVLRFTVALRCGGVSAAIISVAIDSGAGVSREGQGWALGGLACWAAFFTVRALRHGLTFLLVVGDTVVVALVLLAQSRLVPVAAVVDETTWAIMLASTAIYVAQLAVPQVAGLALAAVTIAAYMAGVPASTSQVRVLFVQALVVNALMWLLRRGGNRADTLVAHRDRDRRQAMAEAARRADERLYRAEMHDSVLATLTMVASGAVRGGSPVLAQGAHRALAVLEEFSGPGLSDETVELGPLLGRVASEAPVAVECSFAEPVGVPEQISVAIAGAVGEALRNVAAHAGVRWAFVCAEGDGSGATVVVADRGSGFDPARVAVGRRGISCSIIERMVLVGGTASVESRPGEGTTVTLRWPHG
ncbi:sensor histidine kinase [Actinomadura xylanilytica]|uniref:sensor histidine kinase n=1 Tax=Actinomadura xylanilytica TaxID=887459 RepID=UPI00255B1558|nr:ATP-binding protein [Actinomadura xylanilytica]MDL4773934.1 hypothetical protein [Actinomadura xylanilytica]